MDKLSRFPSFSRARASARFLLAACLAGPVTLRAGTPAGWTHSFHEPLAAGSVAASNFAWQLTVDGNTLFEPMSGTNSSVTFTGIVVNDKPGIPREEVRRLRAILHAAKGTGLEAQNREGRPAFRAFLLGKIAYLSMVDREKGERLRKELEAIPS